MDERIVLDDDHGHLFISRRGTVIVLSHRMHYVDFNEFAL